MNKKLMMLILMISGINIHNHGTIMSAKRLTTLKFFSWGSVFGYITYKLFKEKAQKNINVAKKVETLDQEKQLHNEALPIDEDKNTLTHSNNDHEDDKKLQFCNSGD